MTEGGSLATLKDTCLLVLKQKMRSKPSSLQVDALAFFNVFPIHVCFGSNWDAGQVSILLFNESAEFSSLSQGHTFVFVPHWLVCCSVRRILWHSMCHYPRLFGVCVRAERFVHFFAVLTTPIDVASRPCVQRLFFLVGSLDSTRVLKRNIGRACTTGSSQFLWKGSVDTHNVPAVSHS